MDDAELPIWEPLSFVHLILSTKLFEMEKRKNWVKGNGEAYVMD